MIISLSDIKGVRPIGDNVAADRVNTYILEAERLELLPAIGAAEYQRLAAGTDLTEDETALLNGGYYTNYAGVELYQAGLKAALCYLAYARFVRAQSISITPFGVVVKSTDESQPAGQQAISANAMEAEKVGREYLSQALAFWHSVTESCKGSGRKKRFIGIG